MQLKFYVNPDKLDRRGAEKRRMREEDEEQRGEEEEEGLLWDTELRGLRNR